MTLFEKIKVAGFIIWRSGGPGQMYRTTRKLLWVAASHRFKRSEAAKVNNSVQVNAWAEHTLLTYTDRSVNVRLKAGSAPRIWFILPELDPTMIFGGYIALFQFITYLQSENLATGLIMGLTQITRKRCYHGQHAEESFKSVDPFHNSRISGILAPIRTGGAAP